MDNKITLLCATSNDQKFAIGKAAFGQYGITLTQVLIDIDEIQGEDAEIILSDKAKKAYAAVNAPVIVSDDSWSVPALKGFPGPYMKSVNYWFAPTDFLNLMKDKSDRTIYLDQRLAYIDRNDIVTFSKRIKGIFTNEPHGNSGPPIMRVVELEDDGMTIAESFDKDLADTYGVRRDAWTDAAKWYAKRNS